MAFAGRALVARFIIMLAGLTLRFIGTAQIAAFFLRFTARAAHFLPVPRRIITFILNDRLTAGIAFHCFIRVFLRLSGGVTGVTARRTVPSALRPSAAGAGIGGRHIAGGYFVTFIFTRFCIAGS